MLISTRFNKQSNTKLSQLILGKQNIQHHNDGFVENAILPCINSEDHQDI